MHQIDGGWGVAPLARTSPHRLRCCAWTAIFIVERQFWREASAFARASAGTRRHRATSAPGARLALLSLNRDELERTVGGAQWRFSARCSVRIALVNVRLVVERERLLEQLRKFESELEKRDAQLHEKRTEIEIMSRFCATGRAERRPGAIERSGPCRAAV